jgi:DnaJ-class molecular chaperone
VTDQEEAMTATFTCPQCKGAGDVGWNRRVERCDECDGKGILGSELSENSGELEPFGNPGELDK